MEREDLKMITNEDKHAISLALHLLIGLIYCGCGTVELCNAVYYNAPIISVIVTYILAILHIICCVSYIIEYEYDYCKGRNSVQQVSPEIIRNHREDECFGIRVQR